MKIINLTPHEIVLCGKKIASSGLARCESNTIKVAEIDGIKVNKRQFGAVYGLPEPKANTVYIVSALVAQAISAVRDDVYIVDETVRDEEGKIVGCNALAKI